MRKNPTIAAGILLPLVVAAFFVLASAIPRWLVAPPTHDLLFVVYEYKREPPAIGVRFDVVDERLRAQAFPPDGSYRNLPSLYRFAHDTNAVHEVVVEFPDDPEGLEDGAVLRIPELEGIRISPALQAPDGYEVANSRYDRNGLMGLFFGRRHRSGLALRKSGAIVAVPSVDGRHFYYGDVTFLGWVVDTDG